MNSPEKPRPISTAEEAERAIRHLGTIMDRLVETVEEETAHLRRGRLRDALALETRKKDLTIDYAAESLRLKAAPAAVATALPQALAALRERHAAFQAVLQVNLTVLATAHAVSEGIIRGVSGELARKSAPSTYGAGGRANGPGARAGQPLAISRTL